VIGAFAVVRGSATAAVTQDTFGCCDKSPSGLTLGPDGNVWETDLRGPIYRISADGVFTQVTEISGGNGIDITTGPDSNLWLLYGGVGSDFSPYSRVAKLTTAGDLTSYPITKKGTYHDAITAGPDGAIWFTEQAGPPDEMYRIGRVTPDGAVTEYVTGPLGSDALAPCAITAGPDGNVWFVRQAVPKSPDRPEEIDRISPSGQITTVASTSAGCGIVTGPDGNLWFVDYAGHAVKRITPSGSIGKVADLSGRPQRMAAGPDGSVWVVEARAESHDPDWVAAVSPGGEVMEIPWHGIPSSISAGPGRTMWVGEDSDVVRLSIEGASPFTPPPPSRGETVNAVEQSGSVSVKLPPGAAASGAAGGGFIPLSKLGRQIPIGSTVDTRRGTVRLTAATNAPAVAQTVKTQSADLSGGLFVVTQRHRDALTTFSMTGGNLGACHVRVPHGGAPRLVAARRGRALFSSVHGRFRTRGRNSAATARGTAYLVKDTCAGTLTSVTRGTVQVRDFNTHRAVLVKAHHEYLARAPR
jgi:virginiamycin B lyase